MSGCRSNKQEIPAEFGIDDIAESYVKLSLEIGLYDNDYVDAYYGPDEWRLEKIQSGNEEFPYDELKWKTSKLLHSLEELDRGEWDELQTLRYNYLYKQIIAAKTKIMMISGHQLPFDEESKQLYDAVSPKNGAEYYDQLLTELDQILPGSGDLAERYQSFSEEFIIPPNRLDTVFRTAIAEARQRTTAFIDLPANENFKLEYVTDKSWSGYNWYQGNSFSLIQINTDLPIYIDRAIDLASHEGYPGHHVYNVLLEKTLVRELGWIEFSVYPLFSPQSLIAEGSANFGIEMAFPGEERLNYEKEVLFPLAGIDPANAELYFRVQALKSKLNYAGNEAARAYLDGDISREEAATWLTKYNFSSPERALQRTRFFDQYRSYVINYNLGKDLVADYIKKQGGTTDNPERRWEIFANLLSTPRTAALLE